MIFLLLVMETFYVLAKRFKNSILYVSAGGGVIFCFDELKRNVDGEDSKVNDLSKRNDVDSCVNKILTELEETLKMNMDKLCTDRETYKNEVESLEEKQKNELSTLDNGIKNQFEGLDSDMARMFQLRADEEAKLDGFNASTLPHSPPSMML